MIELQDNAATTDVQTSIDVATDHPASVPTGNSGAVSSATDEMTTTGQGGGGDVQTSTDAHETVAPEGEATVEVAVDVSAPSLLDRLNAIEIIDSVTVDDVTYHVTKPSWMKDSSCPRWTVRQYQEAARITAKLLPVISSIAAATDTSDGRELLLYLGFKAGEIVAAMDEGLFYDIVSTVYVKDGEKFALGYPRDEHRERLSGADGEILMGALKSFLPQAAASPGATPTSSAATVT